jgi:hypothetical protein
LDVISSEPVLTKFVRDLRFAKKRIRADLRRHIRLHKRLSLKGMGVIEKLPSGRLSKVPARMWVGSGKEYL